MPYILDHNVIKELEDWITAAIFDNVLESEEIYRFKLDGIPDSLYKACDYQEIQDIRFVCLDDFDMSPYIEVITESFEDIPYIGADIWTIPNLNAKTIETLCTRLAI